MPKYRVEYHGEIEVDADSEMEAECDAAFSCKPDNCRATCLDDEDSDEHSDD